MPWAGSEVGEESLEGGVWAAGFLSELLSEMLLWATGTENGHKNFG